MYPRTTCVVASFGAVVLWLTVGQHLLAQSSNGPDTPVISQDLLEKFSDRVQLDHKGGLIHDAIEQVSIISDQRIAEAAQQHALTRRQALSTSTGVELTDYSVYRDLLRFPEENRGQVVRIAGISRSVSAADSKVADGTSVVSLIPTDAPAGEVVLLVPSQVELPKAGARLTAVGVFTQLTSLSGNTDKVAPVVLVRELTTEDDASDILLDDSLWTAVKDESLGIQLSEADLYYRLLRKVRTVDESDLKQAAKNQVKARLEEVPRYRKQEVFPVFVDMFKNPASYRGNAVALKGYAREVRKYPAGENAEGIETLYETWIYTEDSQSNPAVVVSTTISDDLPIGDDLQIPVQAVGYFFKIYGYRARDTTRVAPMVLAQTVERRPEPHLEGPPIWLYLLSAIVVLALLVWLVLSYRKERHRTRLAENEPPDFADLP